MVTSWIMDSTLKLYKLFSKRKLCHYKRPSYSHAAHHTSKWKILCRHLGRKLKNQPPRNISRSNSPASSVAMQSPRKKKKESPLFVVHGASRPSSSETIIRLVKNGRCHHTRHVCGGVTVHKIDPITRMNICIRGQNTVRAVK
jgi:hypothetical protein